MISYNIYGVERYGLLCNGNRNFRIDEKFGNLICKDNGFQKLDFISSNQTEYFNFITGNVIPFKNQPAKTMCGRLISPKRVGELMKNITYVGGSPENDFPFDFTPKNDLV